MGRLFQALYPQTNEEEGIILLVPSIADMKEASEEQRLLKAGGGSWFIFHTLVHGTATTCIFMGWDAYCDKWCYMTYKKVSIGFLYKVLKSCPLQSEYNIYIYICMLIYNYL